MNRKIDVVICLGSSCFARGNKAALKAIVQNLNEKNLQDKVFFHGGHCFGKCCEGPVVKIDETIHTGVSESGVIEILNSRLSKE